MAVLKTLRSGKLGAVATILVALGLLSFIIDPNEVISAFNNMSSKYDVGEINGKAISYTDFQDDIQRFSTINEMLTGNQGAAQQDQIRDAAWQDLAARLTIMRWLWKPCPTATIRIIGMLLHHGHCSTLTWGTGLKTLWTV